MLSVEFIEKALRVDASLSEKNPSPRLFKVSIDSRSIDENSLFIAIKGERFDGHSFVEECFGKGVRCFILNRHYRKKIPDKIRKNSIIFFVDNTLKALERLAVCYRKEIFANTVAITGSSGKTTTRELITSILSRKYNVHTAKKNFNNEIGLPLTILETPLDTHILVVELGMNHKGEISRLSQMVSPFVSIITNIGYAHIGNLGSRDAIAYAKAEIFDGMSSWGYAFLNADDEYYEFLKRIANVNVIEFSYNQIKVKEDRGINGFIISYNDEEIEFSLPGVHNLSNLACALKVGEFFNVSKSDIAEAIRNFSPVSGRSEVVKNSITVINDSYNANPSSMKAALELLSKCDGRRIAVISDMLELGKFGIKLHEEIGEWISERKMVDAVFAYGKLSKHLTDKITSNKIFVKWFSTKDEMLDDLINYVRAGDTVLVKASHAMGLEEVTKRLKEAFKLGS